MDLWSSCNRRTINRLGFLNFSNVNGRDAQDGPTASPCQIWSKSVDPRSRYDDFSIFHDGRRRHLGFISFEILTVGTLEMAELRRYTKFGRNRSTGDRDMAIFRFFKMAAAAILDF